ncbi:conserved hypothetical protein [Rubrivivax sp. A210]|uniref:hypothetical protein n=1 Tax=Rubrivivax sp. A210 TaxID=2772301 RepID=UPI001918A0A8|nr:hypothetical protein [Rubrivivax sp. A210]CAD5374300.1 conserved hypothetical protein [Rubrivivax sp. A210]
MKSLDFLSDEEFAQQVQKAVRALPDAPASWQRAAVNLWTVAAFKSAVQSVVRRVAAVLTFDSWATPALAHGMRSLRSPTRHLLFSAQGRDIDLRIATVAETFSVAGQILGPDDAGSIELAVQRGEDRAAHVTHLDALGEFRIDGVRGGTYVLTLRMGGDEIVLPAVEVGERPN